MYVCICHQVTEEQLKKAYSKEKSAQEIARHFKLGESCGICLISALENIDKQLQKENKTNK